MFYTRDFTSNPLGGNDGPRNYLAPQRYDAVITTRDCILSLSDYPDNRYYVPTEKLIEDNFGRIIEVTGILTITHR